MAYVNEEVNEDQAVQSTIIIQNFMIHEIFDMGCMHSFISRRIEM